MEMTSKVLLPLQKNEDLKWSEPGCPCQGPTADKQD